MAVEIKELVIRAIAVPQEAGESPNAQAGTSGSMSTEQMQRLIQQCVDEVLKILERKESR